MERLGLNFAAFISDDRLNATARDDVQIIEQGSEVQYPNYDHIGLQQYPATGNKTLQHTGMGWGTKFLDDLSPGFRDYGVVWTPPEMIFEIDGEPVAAVVTNGAVHGPTDVAFSSALIYAGIPAHPPGHDVLVRSVRVFAP